MPRHLNGLAREWSKWEEWLTLSDPHKFTRFRAGAAKSERQLARAKKIADAALWLLYQDTVGREVPDHDRNPNDLQEQSANVLNVELVNISRLLADLANAGCEPEFIGANASTITNIWLHRRTLAEDLIEYLFNGGAYDHEFDRWSWHVLDRVVNNDSAAVSFPDAVAELVLDYLGAAACVSPLRALGAMIAATLPQYPHAQEAYANCEFRRFDRWCDMVRDLSRFHYVNLDHKRAKALLEVIYPFLLGVEGMEKLSNRRTVSVLMTTDARQAVKVIVTGFMELDNPQELDTDGAASSVSGTFAEALRAFEAEQSHIPDSVQVDRQVEDE